MLGLLIVMNTFMLTRPAILGGTLLLSGILCQKCLLVNMSSKGAAIRHPWYKWYLVEGDVLEAMLHDDGRPGVLVMWHELCQGDA